MLPPAPQCVGLKAAIPVSQSLQVSTAFQLLKSDKTHHFPCQIRSSERDAAEYVKSSPDCQVSEQLPNSAKPHAFPWAKLDFSQIASLLRRIGESKHLFHGKEIHASLRRRSYDYNPYIGNCLIQMYGACGSVTDAQATFNVIQTPNVHSHNILIHAYALNGHFKDAINVFESMSKRNVVSWTTIITSATQQGFCAEAMMLFHRMESAGFAPNMITFISILEACTTQEEGCEIHHSLVVRGFEADTIVATALITMYGSCGSLTNARYIFATMPKKNVVSWGALITTLTENNRPEEALEFFVQMSKQLVVHDKVMYICALNACACFGALKEGQSVHMKMIEEGFEHDIVVGNVLITLYGRSGDLDSAMIIFRKMRKRDSVSWSAIISGCAQSGDSKEALKLFNQMKLEGFEPHTATHVSVLDACCDLMALAIGREVHLAVMKNGSDADTVVGNSLVNLYGKCGGLAEAISAFIRIRQQDVISWNNIISACAQRGHGTEALENFSQMLNEGIEPNSMTFTSVMQACNSIEGGRWRDGLVLSEVCEPGAVVGISLVTVYERWGGIGKARMVEATVCEHNIVASSAMMKAHCKLEVFHDLHQAQLNEINTSCGQSECFFNKMGDCATIDIGGGMSLVMDQYTWIINILNHTGHLPEVEDLLKSIPDATAMIPWLSLLCSCRLHGDIHRGQRAADECLQLDPGNASLYCELTHLCSAEN
ncbi:hypothetical protein GOP47_0028678 [Adiantum capillus-veneris]|nr:hypothetical protein GOP47_0028678 [Adiantum capillus-veneris]